jgi:hypothetical protein
MLHVPWHAPRRSCHLYHCQVCHEREVCGSSSGNSCCAIVLYCRNSQLKPLHRCMYGSVCCTLIHWSQHFLLRCQNRARTDTLYMSADNPPEIMNTEPINYLSCLASYFA